MPRKALFICFIFIGTLFLSLSGCALRADHLSSSSQSGTPSLPSSSTSQSPATPQELEALAENPCLAVGADPSTKSIPALSSEAPSAQVPGFGIGTDLEFGGWGSGLGLFKNGTTNVAFDLQDNLYVLDGGTVTNESPVGNFLVQKFTHEGVFISQFSVWIPALANANSTGQITVDSLGQVYITETTANLVAQFSVGGALLQTFSSPSPFAISDRVVNGVEEIDVMGNNNTNEMTKFFVSYGVSPVVITLSQSLNQVTSLTSDSAGNLYALASGSGQIFKMDPSGNVLSVIGSGVINYFLTNNLIFIGSVSVDSQGFLYDMAFGIPATVVKIDPSLNYMITRPGEFAWNDPWSVFGSYAPMTVDHEDRLWVSVPSGYPEGNPAGTDYSAYTLSTPLYWTNGFHVKPTILRTQTDFLAPKSQSQNLAVLSTLTIGLSAQLQSTLPNQISFDPQQAITMQLSVPAAYRLSSGLTVVYNVQDFSGNLVTQGQFLLPLVNAQAASQNFSFQPKGYGWYSVSAHLCHSAQHVAALNSFVGVTPPYPNLSTAQPSAFGSSDFDPIKSVFIGLPSVRLSATEGLDQLDADITTAQAAGATVFVQLTDQVSDLTSDYVTAAVTRFSGRVKYWEVFNEPNLQMTPAAYVTLAQMVHGIVQSIDPQAQVLGPSVCGIDLTWIRGFYEAGGQSTVDIMAVHDYEGNESIDPVHWRWKYGALRTLMTQFGDSSKAIWQTERAMLNTRGQNFTGVQQATQTALRYNLLESFGIPAEHNMNFYLEEHGFSSVPSYVWSGTGPYPVALSMRVRQAMIAGRAFQNSIDFGPSGNRFLLGLNYGGASGSLLSLSTLGSEGTVVTAKLTGGGNSLNVVDGFGNTSTVAVNNQMLQLTLGQMPQYIQLTPFQSLTFTTFDFGTNIASQATFTYSGTSTSPVSYLNDGLMATYQLGDPNGDVTGPYLWLGQLDNVTPQNMDISFTSARTVNRVVLFGMPPDNSFAALLDFDLQANVGGQWQTLEQVRSPLPNTSPASITDSITLQWLQDTNQFILQNFTPVVTQQLRIVFYRTTRACIAPDPWVLYWGSPVNPVINLKEVEIYGM